MTKQVLKRLKHDRFGIFNMLFLNVTPIGLCSNDEDDVMDLKAIYKIPALRHAFLIVSSLDEFCDNSASSQESRTHTEYLVHILRSKNCTQPKATPQWTLKVMSQEDFLLALRRNRPRKEVLTNQTSYNDSELELLAINLLKTESGLEQKELSFTEDADIIEVFI